MEERQKDMIDFTGAAKMLGVGADQLQAMIDEGLLTPVGDTGEFRAAEVMAVRELGG